MEKIEYSKDGLGVNVVSALGKLDGEIIMDAGFDVVKFKGGTRLVTFANLDETAYGLKENTVYALTPLTTTASGEMAPEFFEDDDGEEDEDIEDDDDGEDSEDSEEELEDEG
jgi:hypothetical protein